MPRDYHGAGRFVHLPPIGPWLLNSVTATSCCFLDGFGTPVAEGSTIVIVPAVSGG